MIGIESQVRQLSPVLEQLSGSAVAKLMRLAKGQIWPGGFKLDDARLALAVLGYVKLVSVPR